MTRADSLFIKTFVFVFSLVVFVSVCLFLCLFLSLRADFLKAEAHSGHCMVIARAEAHKDGNHTGIVWQYHEQKHTETAITRAMV